MNTPLICRSVQFAAGWKLDGGQKPGPWISHHLGRCPRCSSWLARQTQVLAQVQAGVAAAREKHAGGALILFSPAPARQSAGPAGECFPWVKLLSLTGALAALAATLALWQPWSAPVPTRQPLEDWQIAFQETLKKAQEPSALEKEFQAILNDAERAMTAVAQGVGSRDLVAGWSEGY